jgi:WD40-like Beta Propeller Repeat
VIAHACRSDRAGRRPWPERWEDPIEGEHEAEKTRARHRHLQRLSWRAGKVCFGRTRGERVVLASRRLLSASSWGSRRLGSRLAHWYCLEPRLAGTTNVSNAIWNSAMSRRDVRTSVKCASNAALLAIVLGTPPTDAVAQLTPEDVARVAWIEETAISADGQWIAYTLSLPAGAGKAARGRPRDLFAISVAGGEPRCLVSAEWKPGAPAWSPDGALVAFLGESPHGNTQRQVYAVPRHGGEPRPLTAAVTDFPSPLGLPGATTSYAFSPDGRSIAYLASQPVPDSIAKRERLGARG